MGCAAVASPAGSIAVAVTPRGRLYVEHEGAATSRVLSDVATAFAASQAAGLLALASGGALQAALPRVVCVRARRRQGLLRARPARRPMICTARALPPIATPEVELEALRRAAPPMTGAAYHDAGALARSFHDLDALVRAEIDVRGGTVAAYLHDKSLLWNVVGRVCFHLAENKRDDTAPFAFLATYATGVSKGGRVQHAPLGRAIEEYAGARRRDKLLALLEPVHRAAEASAVTRALVDSGDLYHPLAWTAAEAYAFLKDVPVLEAERTRRAPCPTRCGRDRGRGRAWR